MKVPTTEEIQAGYDMITEDGPEAAITYALSVVVLTDPVLKAAILRMHSGVEALLGIPQASPLLRGALSGAMVYGLHLGLHIGEARARKDEHDEASTEAAP